MRIQPASDLHPKEPQDNIIKRLNTTAGDLRKMSESQITAPTLDREGKPVPGNQEGVCHRATITPAQFVASPTGTVEVPIRHGTGRVMLHSDVQYKNAHVDVCDGVTKPDQNTTYINVMPLAGIPSSNVVVEVRIY